VQVALTSFLLLFLAGSAFMGFTVPLDQLPKCTHPRTHTAHTWTTRLKNTHSINMHMIKHVYNV
jgi:hypothetical protein